ncbi:MAG: PHP domain-containing protein [Clostridia bacterium]|nr:PHP domain-containing protein [Clostridia bacterium]
MSYTLPQSAADFISSYKKKMEIHAHTSPVSPCSELPPEKLIALLHKEHYDGVVITNHFYAGGPFMKAEDPIAAYLDDFKKAKEEGEKVGMTVLLGAEFRIDENYNDYLVYGCDEKMLRECSKRFNITLEQFYHDYHSEDIVILQAHPFRNNMTLMPSEYLDGIEAFNMHPNHNSRVAVASKYAGEQKFPIITVGTDLHHDGHEGVASMRVKEVPQNEKELVKLLRSGDYLFEIGGHPLLPYTTF